MRHYILNEQKRNQAMSVYIDDEDGVPYLNFEASNEGIPCGFSLTLNALDREIAEFEAKKAAGNNEEEVDVKQVFENFQKALDNLMKIL